MNRATTERISTLLDEAERRGSLLIANNPSDYKALARRCSSGLLQQPLSGMFVRKELWAALKPPERAIFKMRALAQRNPGWTFCGPSAALLFGLPVTWSYLGTIHVATSARQKSHARPGVKHHFMATPDTEVARELRVTSFWRTVFDCLVMMEGPDALAIADAALRMSGSTRSQLVGHLKFFRRGYPGLQKALDIARLADPLSESGGESIARYMMHELGFACPLLQVWIKDPLEPWRRYRIDYLWEAEDGSLVFGELDGRAKSEDPRLTHGKSKEQVMSEERLRESRLTIYGAKIVRFDEKTARNKRKFAALLESYGVPRETTGSRSWELAPTHSDISAIDGFTVLASIYDAKRLATAA